jgi:hypothetical protein
VPLEAVDGRLVSERLGLDLVQEGEELWLYDPARGERLMTPVELAQRAAEAERRAAEEAQRAAEAEAESDRLRAELEALRRRLGEP